MTRGSPRSPFLDTRILETLPREVPDYTDGDRNLLDPTELGFVPRKIPLDSGRGPGPREPYTLLPASPSSPRTGAPRQRTVSKCSFVLH